MNLTQLLVALLDLPARSREHVGVLRHTDGQLTDLHAFASEAALEQWARLVLLDGGPRDGALPFRARLVRREAVLERIETHSRRDDTPSRAAAGPGSTPLS